jgi:hypothetical protein
MILIPRPPEEWSKNACALNCLVRQMQVLDHRDILVHFQTYHIWCESIWMVSIGLNAGNSENTQIYESDSIFTSNEHLQLRMHPLVKQV